VLRNAALKGDASAAGEIGVCFAEGKGVPVTSTSREMVRPLDNAGVAPAIFRLGTSTRRPGGKKDLDIARRYYVMAAERGNARRWTTSPCSTPTAAAAPITRARRAGLAADRVADSQYNLGTLPAASASPEPRRIFRVQPRRSPGDADSARKRDDIAKRLDPRPPQTRDPDFYRRAAARRRHQRVCPGRRLGQCAYPGQHRQACGQARQAHRAGDRFALN
jgi:localization factor PodJL